MFAALEISHNLADKNSRWWKPPTDTVEQARVYLSNLYGRIRLLNVYQRVFPVEYAASTAGSTRPEGRYSPKEEEFLGLVNERLFELPDIAHDPDFSLGNGTIPINLMGVQTSCECGSPHAENYTAHWQVVMVMTGWSELEDFTELPPDWESHLHQLQYAGKPETERLQSILEEYAGDELEEVGNWKDAAIRHFALMVNVVCRSTDNIFYDVENPIDHDLIWSEENVELLTKEWKRCQEMEKELDELIAWWNKAGARAVQTLVKIWNKLVDAGEIDIMGLPEAAYDLPLSKNEEFLNG
jgi:hypothetical protein